MPPKKRSAGSNGSAGDSKKLRQSTLDCQTNLNNGTHENWESNDSLLVYTPTDIKPSAKILALDLDNTIITTASGKVFATDCNDWKLLNENVRPKLRQYHDNGFKIVIMSNQHGIEKGHVTVAGFQTKIERIIKAINTPIQVLASITSDRNRKPLTGMWEYLEEKGNDGVAIDKAASIYCGDAAGRPAQGARKKDFSCSDRLFALNVGVPFLTPEQLWYDEKNPGPFSLPQFDAKRLYDSPDPVLPPFAKPSQPELIVMVGCPASGKSHFCRTKMAPLGYTIVSRDILGTWQKCVQACKEAVAKGQSVVVDNTNLDVESRGRYIKIAQEAKYPVRCFVLETSVDHARHNERYRMLTDSSHEKISQMVFNMLKSKYKEPSISEGFSEIVKIPFVLDRSMKEMDLYCMHLLEK